MKAVILAGGMGTRLSEETSVRPKPLVTIGGMPILWHIMKIYAAHGIDEFVVLCGYKGHLIKEFFVDYALHSSDMTVDLAKNQVSLRRSRAETWKVTLLDTGLETQTGGRLKRARALLKEDFCFTYGDGVGDVDITKLVAFHRRQGRLATVTAVQPPARFGALRMRGTRVTGFTEKPADGGGWVNAGFFVLSPKAIDTVAGDATLWEKEPLETLARRSQLAAYRHTGFWQMMDTLRDRTHLEDLWERGRAPWKVWR
ncbi:MAG: glucose-1-phosphate cytidylyltransferase [Elusimicrobia bacterium]|nr:glucose-1-phosphate cytidylyltransferase [Elusimicrobiota bacterium]